MSHPVAHQAPADPPPGHPGGINGVGAVRAEGYVYRRAPMIVYWETTLACGLTCGSRARAYAWTGDPLASDPLCPYVPSMA